MIVNKIIKIAICLILAGLLFYGIGLLTGFDGWFPYMHAFNALTIAVWSVLLYFMLGKKLTRRNRTVFLILIVLTALPHILGTLLTYGSWVCLGVSALLLAFLIIRLIKESKA